MLEYVTALQLLNTLRCTFSRISAKDYSIAPGTDANGADLIKRLLILSPQKRLGMLAAGEFDVTGHPFCAHIDMKALVKKEITPPYVPNLKSPLDTANFDDFGTPSSGKKYNKYLDAKYDETWVAEFGALGM